MGLGFDESVNRNPLLHGMRPEDAAELGLAMERLMGRVADAGLFGGQVEALLGLAFGEWNLIVGGRPGWRLSGSQERRARLAVELLDRLHGVIGGWEATGAWLAAGTDELDGASPLEWASASAEHLFAMVAALRAEAE